jgi:hypothetical protein
MYLLLFNNTGEFSFNKNLVGDDTISLYMILSYTWGADAKEVTFKDITNSIGKDKPNYEKIQFCGEQARIDSLQYFWIDTCCTIKQTTLNSCRLLTSYFTGTVT